MELNNHLLYIDITNMCNLNCDFCMYKEERKRNPLNLTLNNKTKNNISNLINHPETERLIISGEGEPFNNLEGIYKILNLSKGGKNIQIISNGLWLISDNSRIILNNLDKLSKSKKDKYQIRISFDTFHADKIGKKNYKRIINQVLEYKNKSDVIEICFRGILEEKEKILQFLKKEFLNHSKEIKFKRISSLETDIFIGDNQKINFIFKNLIDLNDLKEKNSFDDYLISLEKIYGKPFTLGHLKQGNNGMDITIKPNGDVYFYGAEIYSIKNIYQDNISIETLENVIENDKILRTLYTVPLKKLTKSFNKYKPFKEIIRSINNPYWIIKKMYQFNKGKFEDLINVN